MASSCFWMVESSPKTATYCAAFLLQATSSSTGILAMLGSVVTWSPRCRVSVWSFSSTVTVPSTTETRDPLVPVLTAKMVPFTETRQSAVATYSLPLRCLAACTITLPRSRWMVVPRAVRVKDTCERSFISTSEPSVSRRTAVEPLEVRTACRSPSSLPEKMGVLERSAT